MVWWDVVWCGVADSPPGNVLEGCGRVGCGVVGCGVVWRMVYLATSSSACRTFMLRCLETWLKSSAQYLCGCGCARVGGCIDASGIAQSQDVTVNTGGVYEGRELETENTEVFVQAGGEVEVYASKIADITVRAGGDVDVYGKPESVKRRRTFGGRIRIM